MSLRIPEQEAAAVHEGANQAELALGKMRLSAGWLSRFDLEISAEKAGALSPVTAEFLQDLYQKLLELEAVARGEQFPAERTMQPQEIPIPINAVEIFGADGNLSTAKEDMLVIIFESARQKLEPRFSNLVNRVLPSASEVLNPILALLPRKHLSEFSIEFQMSENDELIMKRPNGYLLTSLIQLKRDRSSVPLLEFTPNEVGKVFDIYIAALVEAHSTAICYTIASNWFLFQSTDQIDKVVSDLIRQCSSRPLHLQQRLIARQESITEKADEQVSERWEKT